MRHFFRPTFKSVLKHFRYIDSLSELAGVAKHDPVHSQLYAFLFYDLFVEEYTKFRRKHYEVVNSEEFKVTLKDSKY